jgi:hypothetical protein
MEARIALGELRVAPATRCDEFVPSNTSTPVAPLPEATRTRQLGNVTTVGYQRAWFMSFTFAHVPPVPDALKMWVDAIAPAEELATDAPVPVGVVDGTAVLAVPPVGRSTSSDASAAPESGPSVVSPPGQLPERQSR